jgi:hypothetical protein
MKPLRDSRLLEDPSVPELARQAVEEQSVPEVRVVHPAEAENTVAGSR